MNYKLHFKAEPSTVIDTFKDKDGNIVSQSIHERSGCETRVEIDGLDLIEVLKAMTVGGGMPVNMSFGETVVKVQKD